MTKVREQYEAYPYPERDPEDEKKRLIQGSPSHPLEMDHFLWNGERDWSMPLKALVAGGGTGDGLIQLATVLTQANRPYDITYIDLSTASRRIAESRAKVRGLKNITFLSGDLLSAPELGQFDYIDCCGVLHHLPDPAQGFRALSDALAPDGGLGLMVYAPYGRSGVYPLQEAFGAVFSGLPPKDRLKRAKAIFAEIPEGHPFKRNPHLVDHQQSDAGFYDLLLHSQDQAFDVTRLCQSLTDAGLELSGFFQPTQYDLSRFTIPPKGMDPVAQMAAAEKFDGTIKTHVAYAKRKGETRGPATGRSVDAIAHLKGIPPRALAGAIAQLGGVELTINGTKIWLEIPKGAAPLIARIDGKTGVAEIKKQSGQKMSEANKNWKAASGLLAGWGQLWYSRLLVR